MAAAGCIGLAARGRQRTACPNAKTRTAIALPTDRTAYIRRLFAAISTYTAIVGPIVNEDSVHPPCTHCAPRPPAITANAIQVERRRNPHLWAYLVLGRTSS